jgi:RNA polymerase sigma-70 factor (ECF subfamily)
VPRNPTNVLKELNPEVELIAAARDGDLPAYLELVRYYQEPVYRLAYALTRNPDDAAGLARETFARGWKGLSGYPEKRRFLPWLLRIERNLAVTLARRRGPSSRPAASDGSASDAQLLTAFAALRPDEQMALCLRSVERLPYIEIAAILDISQAAAILRIAQARGVLLAHTTEEAEPGA